MAEHLDEPPTLRARARSSRPAAFPRSPRAPARRAGGARARNSRCGPVPGANGARGKADPLALGLFARGTHDLVEIPGCVVHHPRINQAARYVADVANAAGVRAYDEKTGDGHLRYAQLTAVASAERGAAHLDEDATVQVALVWNGRPPVVGASMPAALRRFIDALVGGDVDAALLHGVWVNFNDSSTNEIVSADSKNWRHAHGPAYQWSRHGDARVCYAPGSFLQANTEAYNALLSAVRRHVPAGSAVSELYAGAGAIGLSLAASETSYDSFSLRCVEIVEAARETFDLSARETLGHGPEGDARLANVAFRAPPPPTPPPRRCAARTRSSWTRRARAWTRGRSRRWRATTRRLRTFTDVRASRWRLQRTRGTGSRARRGLDAKSETNATAALRRNVT